MYRLSRISILTVLLVSLAAVNCYAQGAAGSDSNGISYILLPKTYDSLHGVYRLNSYAPPYAKKDGGTRLFDLNFDGANVVNGLTVNQTDDVFLFVGPNVTGEYTPVSQVGWVPSSRFEDDSPAFVKLIGQPYNKDQISKDWPIQSELNNATFDAETTNYDNTYWDYVNCNHHRYYKGNYTDAAGNSYQYKFDPYSPASHKDTPLWNGPGAGSAGVHHSTDPYKVVLPNKWGGISWYAFGSPKASAAHVGKLMNGEDGLPEMDQNDFRLAKGTDYSPYSNAKYISCVVKRVYESRERALDLYAYPDKSPVSGNPPYTYPSKRAGNVLTATDLKITEQYGKSCADGCIPGGTLNPEAIGKIESTVSVFTSTTGNRYGYNPFGKKTPPFSGNDAALRVVHKGTDYNLTLDSTNIRNASYVTDYLGVALENLTLIGVSSNFSDTQTSISKAPDYLYGSVADKFCIQDSWWGNGGVAYEYYSKEVKTKSKTFEAGHIYRLNYLESTYPTPEDVGYFPGDIDAIAVDGHGHLYILYTELDCPNVPAWPSAVGLPQGPDITAENPTSSSSAIKSHKDFLKVGKWMRPDDGSKSNNGMDGDYEISGPSKDGDYISVFMKQRVRKVCRKYTPSAGGGFSTGSVEERGYVDAGFDAITRVVEYNGAGGYSWLNAWHHDESSIVDRKANFDAEFAVVNKAEVPVNYNTAPTYSICRSDRTTSATPIEEGNKVKFKVEGFCPYGADGTIQDLIGIGTIPGLGSVRVNLIPPYENRDEDGDGIFGGFPSSMFDSANKPFTVKWHIDMLEPATAYDSTKIIKSFATAELKSGDRQYEHKFDQPGNYAVYADITYHFFNYDAMTGSNLRPSDLAAYAGSKTVTTQKIIYHVQAEGATVTDGYITNIKLNNHNAFSGKYITLAGGAANIARGNQASGYAFPEKSAPEKLSFSFDAQFIKDANIYTGAAYETQNGVGVWDYGESMHVYNYDSTTGGVLNNVFNPGRKKYEDGDSLRYKYGTRIDEKPSAKDLKHFEWRLLIYPPYRKNPTDTATVADVPLVLGEGTLEGAIIEDPVDPTSRMYKISYNIPIASLTNVLTPIDPETYLVRLELTYPRVKWEDVVTAPGVTKTQYKSIVPDSPRKAKITNEIWIGTADVGKENPTSDTFVDGIDTWEICARDFTVMKPSYDGLDFSGVTSNNVQVATHTTSDPITPCKIGVSLQDNNPNAAFSAAALEFELPKQNRTSAVVLSPTKAPGEQTSEYGPLPTSPTYYNSSLTMAASYSFEIDAYGGALGNSEYFSPSKTYENWIGSLSFSLTAELRDGYDGDGTEPVHVFGKNAENNLKTYTCGLVRYDNDPPSLLLNVVAQSDDKRWVIKLVEADKDLVANPSTLDELAKPELSAHAIRLSTSDDTGDKIEVAPSSNYSPKGIDLAVNEHINLTQTFEASYAKLHDFLPVVRRSSRIMISAGATDNVDYKEFKEIKISVIERRADGGTTILLPETSLKTDPDAASSETALHKTLRDNYLERERGIYYVDVPMKVKTPQSVTDPQIVVYLTATDASGNKRSLSVPIRVVDSSFDARIIETIENKN
ncbi:MAG: hypothetical protein PHF29_05395 [Candidatus Riflebacteria bacterium]|nr:hypothetical protein [Candidatus Riflebacteria bacterium]